PNLARREHAKNLVPLLTQALDQSQQNDKYRDLISVNSVDNYRDHNYRDQISVIYGDNSRVLIKDVLAREEGLYEALDDFLTTHEKPAIDCIAVTYGPGLEPALWVGVNFARALSIAWDIPLVGVNHMEGHIMMSLMHNDRLASFEFPLLSLLISGGHTELVLSRAWMQYEVIGQTRDDAVGEAFDKVARLLGLPYPGGPEISKFARLDRTVNPEPCITFTPPMLRSDDFDFSFSGIKTEVRKFVETQKAIVSPRSNLGESLGDDLKAQIARGFEDAVATVLVAKTMRAVEKYGARSVLVGGGVSANSYIHAQLADALKRSGDVKLLVPPPNLATDNALMIALAGYFHALKQDFADPKILRADGNLRLA
ncbi:MAG TPA: tRNA (adenosine(37)-N6)-threonylcarbamoyltransferase complex transferase subunit TsaD, partial [Candidatus Paceibacterota bacterium]|nr:tRNA (adenosine(37)-N6)-threonylcarbamoyltransferase complex transferase subunit TsaD [Candidatus Paceibacterota bacterium]